MKRICEAAVELLAMLCEKYERDVLRKLEQEDFNDFYSQGFGGCI